MGAGIAQHIEASICKIAPELLYGRSVCCRGFRRSRARGELLCYPFGDRSVNLEVWERERGILYRG